MPWRVIRQQQESPEPIRNRQVPSPARENNPFWVTRSFLYCLSLEVGSYVTAIIGALWALLGALDGCLTLANSPSWDNAGLNIFRPQVPGAERFVSRNGTGTVPISSGGGEYIVTPDLAPVALFLGVDTVQLIFCIGFGLVYCCVWHPRSLFLLRMRVAGRVGLALIQVSSFATAAALIQTKQAAAIHDDRPSARIPGQGILHYSVANAVILTIIAALVNGFGVYTLMCISWVLESDQKPSLEMGQRNATIQRQPSLPQAERSFVLEVGNRGDGWAPSTLRRSATLPSRLAPPSHAFVPDDNRLTRQYGTVSRMDGLRDVDRSIAGDWARTKPSLDISRSLPRTWADGRPISEERSEGATLSRIYPGPEGKYSIGSNQTDSLQRAVLGVMNRSNTLQSRSTNPSTLINEPGSFLALEPWRQNVVESHNLSSPTNAYPSPPPIPGEHVLNTLPPQFGSVDRRRGTRLRSQSVDETRSPTNQISPRSPNVSALGTPSLSRRAPPPMATPVFMQRVHEQKSAPPLPTESAWTPAGTTTLQPNTVEAASPMRTFEVTTTPTFNAQPTPKLQDLRQPPPPMGTIPPAPVRHAPHVEFSSTVQTSEVPRRRYSEIYSTLDRSEYEPKFDSLPRTDSRSRANDSLGRSDSQSRRDDSLGRSDSRSRTFDSLGRSDSRNQANDTLPRSEFSTYPRSDGYPNNMSPGTTMTRSEFAPTRSADTTLSRSEGQSTMSRSDSMSDGGREGYFGTRVTSGGDGRRQSGDWESKNQQAYNAQSSNAHKVVISDPLGAPSNRAHERQMKEAALHMAAEKQIWKQETATSQYEGIKMQTKVIEPAVSIVPQVQTVVIEPAVSTVPETSTVPATPQSTSPDTPNRPVISPYIDRASLMTQTTGTSGTGPAHERERQRRFGRVLEEGEESEQVQRLGIPTSGSSARTSDANPVDHGDTVSERDIYDAYDWTSQRDSTPDVSRTVSFASTVPGRGDVFAGQSPTPRPVGPNLTVPPKNIRRFQKDPLS
ncbi:hypothetical protein BJ742DRAFT_479615 [Cladochytrium replicatum]|nr:hypothetical protein BJ742DRAFT_479615 [Cladochytrium replicatum]